MRKQEQLDLEAPMYLETYIPGQVEPLIINGVPELLIDLAAQEDARYKAQPKHIAKPAMAHVEAPKPAVSPEPAYIDLAHLDRRQIARMSLKAFAYDIRTGGRNDQYRRFKAQVAAEKDLAIDMELGLVQRVHCRLHEKLLSKVGQ